MVVDLARDQARFIGGALNGGRLVGAPQVPQTDADERGERNDSGDDQSDKTRSNAAEQHQKPLLVLFFLN